MSRVADAVRNSASSSDEGRFRTVTAAAPALVRADDPWNLEQTRRPVLDRTEPAGRLAPGSHAALLPPARRDELLKLVQAVFFASADRGRAARSLLVCGAGPEADSSHHAIVIAELLAAQTAGSVCLVDANLRSPLVHRRCELDPSPGFAEAVLAGEPLRDAARPLGGGDLRVVTAGARTSEVLSALGSEAVRGQLAALLGSFDYVVMDAPAATAYPDAAILAADLDGVVITVEAEVTRPDVARQASDRLAQHGGRVLGAVLNNRRYPIPDAVYRRL